MAFDQDALVASPLWLLDDHRCKLKHAGTGWIDCHFDPVQAGAAKGLQACQTYSASGLGHDHVAAAADGSKGRHGKAQGSGQRTVQKLV